MDRLIPATPGQPTDWRLRAGAVSPQKIAHGGYHWRGKASHRSDRFFEGWYFRLTLPEVGQSFAFMYSIDDPAGGSDYSGGAAQILGPDEAYYCRTFSNPETFWAWPHKLGLGHWRSGKRSRYLPSEAFERQVKEGYQATATQHQGKLRSPGGSLVAHWSYQTRPLVSWGLPSGRATAGWLSYLPVFDPGWQVLMAHGLSSGYMTWYGQTYRFTDAPTYAEKNWGTTFPIKWFWIQCNAFLNEPGVALTAAGGTREVLGKQENVGLVGVHHQGRFYEFLSTKTRLTWVVDPWGYWHVSAQDYRYRVEVIGRAIDAGAQVRVPTRSGLRWLCRDTTHGKLHLTLWDLKRKVRVISATSPLAGLEVGGSPWTARWVGP